MSREYVCSISREFSNQRRRTIFHQKSPTLKKSLAIHGETALFSAEQPNELYFMLRMCARARTHTHTHTYTHTHTRAHAHSMFYSPAESNASERCTNEGEEEEAETEEEEGKREAPVTHVDDSEERRLEKARELL